MRTSQVGWLGLILVVLTQGQESRAQLVWSGAAGNGQWDSSSINWLNGGIGVAFANGDSVQFDDSATQGLVSLAAPLSPSSILVWNDSTPYQFSGATITGTGGLTKEGGESLVLASSNAFSGGIALNSGVVGSGSPRIVCRAAGALGTGPVTLYGGAFAAPSTLHFDAVPSSNVVANDIRIAGPVGASRISAGVSTWLTGSLDVETEESYLALDCPGGSRGGTAVLVVAPAPGKTVTMATNTCIDCSSAWSLLLDFTSISNLPPTAGLNTVGCAGLVLSPGFTWSNLVAQRSWLGWSYLRGPFWSGNCFAARGADQVIDSSGTFPTGESNTWLTAGVGPNSPVYLGSPLRLPDGSLYANANLTISRDIVVRDFFHIGVGATGAGLTRQTGEGVITELAGTISGPGVLVTSANGDYSEGRLPELVLAGASRWTGGVNEPMGGAMRIMTGPGGLCPFANFTAGFVRFKGNGSLPSGNAGAPAYLLALANIGAPNPCGLYGYLLTGSAPTPQVYCLTNGLRFVIGGDTAYGVGPDYGVLGSAIGTSVLTNSQVSIYNQSQDLQYLALLVRDTNSTLVLGSAAGAVAFSSCTATNTSYPGVDVLAVTNLPAEPMFDRYTPNVLVKRGSGTLVVSNVTYERFAGGGDVATNFSWQLGGGTLGQDDGVVLETGSAANNSMRQQSITMDGAVMGLVSDFTAQVGTNQAQVDFTGAAGGGFAAYGAPRTVTLVPWGATNTLGWGVTDAATPEFFMRDTAPLLLNARDADAAVRLASAPGNAIRLATDNGSYVINVQDNPASGADQAELAVPLSSSASLAGATLVKTGPGVLVLSAATNTYEAGTVVSNGTLVVNGSIASNRVASASNVTVCAGATLTGTGSIQRVVRVLSDGNLVAGDLASGAGTLLLGSDLVMDAGSSLRVSVSPEGGYGTVHVAGCAQMGGVITSTVQGPLSGDAVLIQADGGISTNGVTAELPRGYVLRLGAGNTQLTLHYSAPGFVIRIE